MHRNIFKILFSFFFFFQITTALQAQEICNNGIDDDGDGFIDCGDTECGGTIACQDAFTCDSKLYQVISGSLKELDVASSSYVTLGDASASYNGAGYNVQDGYIYGIRNNSGAYLWRINNNGTETDLGQISNFAGRNYVGDFDTNGNLYTYTSGSNPTMHYVDVNASPLTSVEVSLTKLSSGDVPGVSDITYNSITQKFYGMSGGMALVELDPVNQTVDVSSSLDNGFNSSGGFGAAWSDSGGYSYFSNNNDGRIYRVTFDGSGNVIATVHIATGEKTNSNDGMGCFLAAPPFETDCTNGIDDDGDGLIDCDDPDCGFETFCANIDVSVTATETTGPTGVVSYHIFLTNNSTSDATSFTMSDVMPSGFTFIGDTIDFDDGLGSYDESLRPADGATGTLIWGNISLPAGETMRISYDAMVSNAQPNGTHTNGVIISGASTTGTTSDDVIINSSLTATPTPFACDPSLYQVYQKRGEPNVYGKLNPVTGDYSIIATISHQANGLGFDRSTGLAYGSVGKQFISLDDAGTVKTLGLSFSKKVFVGDMDTLGYWYGKDGGDIKKVDISGPTLVATYSGQGMPGWDMAYNKDGNFYAVHNSTLYKFSTATNTKSTVGTLVGDNLPSGGFGAQWTGKNGYLYISHNSTGRVYRVDVTTLEARFVLLSTAGLRFNDGFSCPTDIPAVYKKDFSDLSSHPQAIHLVFAQDVAGDNIPDYNMVWMGTKVSEESDDPSNSTGTGDSHDDGLVYPTTFTPGGTANVNIDLRTNVDGQTVHYGLWIDWDNDGTFDSFNNGSQAVTKTANVVQAIDVPADFAGGNVVMRARVSESALGSNDFKGQLLLGEVEDYVVASRVAGTGTKEISCLKINFACNAPESYTYIYNDGANNDLDNDGIPNNIDPDPKDPNKQFSQCKPSCNTFGTLAYEDLWPQKGDYDFNDFVVQINEKIYTNTSNAIYQMTFDLRIMAMGGQYNNDFCIAVPDPNGIATFEVYSVDNVRYTSEDADGYKIIKIDKPKELLDVPTAEVVNAISGGTHYAPLEIQVVVDINGDYNYPAGYTPKFFLEGNGINGHEIHLPGVAPTSKMKDGILGTVHDDSNSGSGKYYMSETNLPWALYIPAAWKYPQEAIDLLDAYFRFDEYVQTDPSLSWYLDDDTYRTNNKCYNE